MPVLIEDNDSSNDAPISELNPDRPASKLADDIFSDLDGENASYLEPYDEDLLFFTDRQQVCGD